MSSVDYENHLLNAIETIVDNTVNKAGYDKTIKAIIDKCLDATLGSYQVKYQDSVFEAFAADKNVKYQKGTLVQVLIPGNDMSQNKTILNPIQSDTIEIVESVGDDFEYNITGSNIISNINNEEFGLCSYKKIDNIHILYDKDNPSNNKINLDIQTFESIVKSADAIKCGANFKTELPSEQAIRGNYGIVYEINFWDNIIKDPSTLTPEEKEKAIVTKKYIIDINQIIGNPYNLKNYTFQSKIF